MKQGCAVIIFLIVIIGVFGGFFVKHIYGNKQIFDLQQNFTTAYVKSEDGKFEKIKISKWIDFDQSDSIQIISTNGRVIYTHLSNVILTNE